MLKKKVLKNFLKIEKTQGRNKPGMEQGERAPWCWHSALTREALDSREVCLVALGQSWSVKQAKSHGWELQVGAGKLEIPLWPATRRGWWEEKCSLWCR